MKAKSPQKAYEESLPGYDALEAREYREIDKIDRAIHDHIDKMHMLSTEREKCFARLQLIRERKKEGSLFEVRG